MIKLAIVETVYGIWKYKNNKIFNKSVNITNIAEKFVEVIVYRGGVVISLKIIYLIWWCNWALYSLSIL